MLGPEASAARPEPLPGAASAAEELPGARVEMLLLLPDLHLGGCHDYGPFFWSPY